MIRKFARPMLASVYVADGVETVLNPSAHRDDAQAVLKKVRSVVPREYRSFVPDSPETAALAMGGVKVGAGALFALGKAPRTAASLLAATAVPSLLGRHAFWDAHDEQEKTRRRTGALTDVALLGGVLLATVDTEGKPNLQWRAKKAASQTKKNVQKALPTQSETEKAMGKASDWLSDTTEQVTSYVDDNKDDWKKAAGSFLEDAKEQTTSLLSTAADQAQSTYEDLKPSKVQQFKAKRKVNSLVGDLQNSLDNLAPSDADKKKAKRKATKASAKVQGRAQEAVDKLQDAFDNLDVAPSKRQQRQWKRKANKAQKRAQKAVKRAQKKLG
ncbi:DoxX family membrane protein [Corynebacterium senegalense]|uniref:DoxX family membrane protein n=1 Tax=Corynebacterium senegalense TaxID=2080750 RepID=UPI000E1FE66D|nr:DoxX family protein [Corynebacterium senegalense]